MKTGDNPIYKHDCENCIFIQNYDGMGHDGCEDGADNKPTKYDIYICPQGGRPTMVVRYENYGPDYYSLPVEMVMRKGHPLLTE